jgi:hypothetical protein
MPLSARDDAMNGRHVVVSGVISLRRDLLRFTAGPTFIAE